MAGWSDGGVREAVRPVPQEGRDFRSPQWGTVTPGVGDNLDRGRGNDVRRERRPAVPDRRYKPGRRLPQPYRPAIEREAERRRRPVPSTPKPNRNFARLPRRQFAVPPLPLRVPPQAFRNVNPWLRALDLIDLIEPPLLSMKMKSHEQLVQAGWTLVNECLDLPIDCQVQGNLAYTDCYFAWQHGAEALGTPLSDMAWGLTLGHRRAPPLENMWVSVRTYGRPPFVFYPQSSVMNPIPLVLGSTPLPQWYDPEQNLPQVSGPDLTVPAVRAVRPPLLRVPSQSHERGYGEPAPALDVATQTATVGETIIIYGNGDGFVAPGIPPPGKTFPPRNPQPSPVVGRPPRGTKEAKIHAQGMFPGVYSLANVLTEGADFIEEIYKSIPAKYRRPVKDTPVVDMLPIIFDNFEHVDWGKALQGLIENHYRDKAQGRLTQAANRQYFQTPFGRRSLVSPAMGWAM